MTPITADGSLAPAGAARGVAIGAEGAAGAGLDGVGVGAGAVPLGRGAGAGKVPDGACAHPSPGATVTAKTKAADTAA